MRVPWPSAYVLLVLTTLFWSGNFVLGRAVHLEVPPVGLAFWRWAIALVILLPFTWRAVAGQWGLIRSHFPLLALLGILGVANFNTFVYTGLQSTTATNAVLLQSIVPVLIVGLARFMLGDVVKKRQALGILVSLTGVVTIIGRGDLSAILGLELAVGDLWILAAVLSWALYSVLLQRRPAGLDPFVFLTFSMIVGVVALAPAYAWEVGSGRTLILNKVSMVSVAYVAVFPSLLAYVFWNRAVAEVGPNRAGQFIHLMPVFGTVLSVAFLGEVLHLFHLFGAMLIVAGILLTTMRRSLNVRRGPPDADS